MIDGIQIKVCGLTSLVDAAFADACGADYLGFVLYPKSPRCVSIAQCRSMAGRLPERQKVAVAVEPDPRALLAMRDAGFNHFQVHFRHDVPVRRIEAWTHAVGAETLWLAPKLPPEVDVPESWLGLSRGILLDTFDSSLFGGTGRTGDWAKFKRHRQRQPGKTWILSGGLNPENVGEALAKTGARFIDVNSGVESAPGVKDHAKMKALVVAVHKAAGR
ncbi:MAG TPA: phosphoribosylanthranilate isomerase [Opitutaceae bacterium]|nr:phosphoribosylanthranilate isomerase [Opitutaceae bacterium]